MGIRIEVECDEKNCMASEWEDDCSKFDEPRDAFPEWFVVTQGPVICPSCQGLEA